MAEETRFAHTLTQVSISVEDQLGGIQNSTNRIGRRETTFGQKFHLPEISHTKTCIETCIR